MEFVLELDNGQNLKLPNHVLVPITQIRMFNIIVKSNYKIRLYIGNGIYRKLRPIWVEIDLRNFGKNHQHRQSDDQLEQITNQETSAFTETDSGFHEGFVQVAVQTPDLQYKSPIHKITANSSEKDQLSKL